MCKHRFLGAILAALAILGLSSATTKAEPAVLTYDLNLRYGPGLEYPVILTMEYGSVVEVEQCYNDEWCEIQYGEYYGYAHSNYMDFAAYAPGYIAPPRVVAVPRYYYNPYTRYYRDYKQPRRAKRYNYAPPRAVKQKRRKANLHTPNRQHRVQKRSARPRAIQQRSVRRQAVPRRAVQPNVVKKRVKATVRRNRGEAAKHIKRNRPKQTNRGGRNKAANRAAVNRKAVQRSRGGKRQSKRGNGKRGKRNRG